MFMICFLIYLAIGIVAVVLTTYFDQESITIGDVPLMIFGIFIWPLLIIYLIKNWFKENKDVVLFDFKNKAEEEQEER